MRLSDLGFAGTEQQVLAGSDGVFAIAIHLNEPMQLTLTKEPFPYAGDTWW